MRLIDADALNKELHSLGGAPAEPATWDDGWNKAIDEAICLLNRAPTMPDKPKKAATLENLLDAVSEGCSAQTYTAS